MDTSVEYIKICMKAEEIQNEMIKPPYNPQRRIPSCEYHLSYVYWFMDDKVIWLPRQDQLQILSRLSWQEFDKECSKYDMPTKEQAGLKVVMKLLFDKTI